MPDSAVSRMTDARKHAAPASVVIPTWRRPEHLVRCLLALGEQSTTPTEVIVVARADDLETTHALSTVKAQSSLPLRTVFVQRPGLIAALNLGVASASSEVVCLLDDDAAPHPDWLERIAAHYQDRLVVAVGGRDWVHYRGRRVDDTADVVGMISWYGRCVGNHHLGHGASRQVDFLKGVNLSFRRDAISGEAFDSSLRGSGSQPHGELGLCLRLAKEGLVIYDPAVGVEHYLGIRWDDERADARSLRDITDASHNQFYGLMAHLTGVRRAIVFVFQMLVGSRSDPGPVLVAERLLARDLHVVLRCRAATTGRLMALGTLWRRRRARRAT
jgi:glycosyltransferase involved in cell wall biosynthesis